jgi:hypothetical protein
MSSKFAKKVIMKEINSFEEFERLLMKGHEDFYWEYRRSDGKILGEEAPFDQNDPMSYVIVKLIYLRKDLSLKLYKVSKQ